MLLLWIAVALLAALSLGALVASLTLHARLGRFELARQRAERDQRVQLEAGLMVVERQVRAARNESATFLEAIFTGVRGLARNVDATRTTTVETLEELRKKIPVEPEEPADAGRPFDTVPETSPPGLEELRKLARKKRPGRDRDG